MSPQYHVGPIKHKPYEVAEICFTNLQHTASHGITKVTQGFAKYHTVSQGFTKYHTVSQGFTKYHTVSQGIANLHKVSQGIIKCHKASQKYHKVPHSIAQYHKKRSEKVTVSAWANADE